MARLNNILKFIIFHVNFLFSLIGLGLMGFGIYLMVADWGQLDKGFFMGAGAVLLVSGYVASITAVMGNFGVTHQKHKYGSWSGRRILFVYQTVIVATLIGLVYSIFVALIAINSLKVTSQMVAAGEDPSFSSMEQYISNRFNLFFFGAAYKTCGDARYSFFWPWINSNCEAAIDQANCQKCEDYSPVSCVAESTICPTDGAGNDDPTNIGCPYTYCREAVLSFLVGNISTFSYIALGIMVFALIVMITTCMLICYTERDTIDKQVFKSGTLANNQLASSTGPGGRPQSQQQGPNV